MPSSVRPKSRPKRPPTKLQLEVEDMLKNGWKKIPPGQLRKTAPKKRLPTKKHPFPVQTG